MQYFFTIERKSMNITAGPDRAAHIWVKEMIFGTNEHDVAMP